MTPEAAQLMDEFEQAVVSAIGVPLLLFPHLVERVHDPLLGTIEFSRYVQDNDRGDEDSTERPRWTVAVRVVEPVVLPVAIHSVSICGTVSL